MDRILKRVELSDGSKYIDFEWQKRDGSWQLSNLWAPPLNATFPIWLPIPQSRFDEDFISINEALVYTLPIETRVDIDTPLGDFLPARFGNLAGRRAASYEELMEGAEPAIKAGFLKGYIEDHEDREDAIRVNLRSCIEWACKRIPELRSHFETPGSAAIPQGPCVDIIQSERISAEVPDAVTRGQSLLCSKDAIDYYRRQVQSVVTDKELTDAGIRSALQRGRGHILKCHGSKKRMMYEVEGLNDLIARRMKRESKKADRENVKRHKGRKATM